MRFVPNSACLLRTPYEPCFGDTQRQAAGDRNHSDNPVSETQDPPLACLPACHPVYLECCRFCDASCLPASRGTQGTKAPSKKAMFNHMASNRCPASPQLPPAQAKEGVDLAD